MKRKTKNILAAALFITPFIGIFIAIGIDKGWTFMFEIALLFLSVGSWIGAIGWLMESNDSD